MLREHAEGAGKKKKKKKKKGKKEDKLEAVQRSVS